MESEFKNKSLAIIIPMYNEQKIVERCIDAVMLVIKKFKNRTALIIVNDGSQDATQKLLKKKSKQYKEKLIVLEHKKNKGYGAAVKMGIAEAAKQKFGWCLHMDSDLTNDPRYIANFAANMSDQYDCIKASRYIKGSKIINVPYFRRIISILGNLFASLMFGVGIKDCTNGFRMVRLAVIKDLKFKQNNFSIILEELYYLKKKHSRFREIPYTLTARTDSKSHFKYSLKIFRDYFRYALRAFLLP